MLFLLDDEGKSAMNGGCLKSLEVVFTCPGRR